MDEKQWSELSAQVDALAKRVEAREKIDLVGLGAVASAKPKGLGCPPRDEKILRLAALSPRAAWAELTGAVKAPFLATIQATFDTTSDTIADGDLDAQVLGAETFIQDLIFDIQVPSAFSGNVMKSLYDFFYNKTSGIAARLLVTGRPRYDVAPNYVPLSNLADFMPSFWPDGWMLTRYNSIHMDFQAQSPLPFAPVNVSATIRGWQYVCPDIDAMPLDDILCKLGDIGYVVDYLRNCRCQY